MAFVGALYFIMPVNNYLFEISHDFDGPVEGIVKFLEQKADKNDIVAITYEDLPVKLYTGLRVVGGLTGEDLKDVKNARWVIIRKNIGSKKDLLVRQYIEENLDLKKYKKIILDYPDTRFQNREDPKKHLYATAKDEDRVVIYERPDS